MERSRKREAEGAIRQCNEGKLEFRFEETRAATGGGGGDIVLEVAVPKYLDSSLIDLDVHPHYVSIVIKGKVCIEANFAARPTARPPVRAFIRGLGLASRAVHGSPAPQMDDRGHRCQRISGARKWNVPVLPCSVGQTKRARGLNIGGAGGGGGYILHPVHLFGGTAA